MNNIRYVKKEYEVLEGEIENTFCPVVKACHHVADAEPHEGAIILPHTFGRNTDVSLDAIVPPAKDRYKIIKKAQAAGLYVGVSVIRVIYLKPAYIANPRMIGTVQRFLFNIWPGYGHYLPVLVRYTQGDGSFQDFPFAIEEIETLENARKQMNLVKESTEPNKNLFDDLWHKRNGVIPIRQPQTILSLPYKRD